ncbi:GntR family transcriptional regulator [Paenibacillus nasutitermitis]|uniref:UbiC transcription regulator-associated domain protein n=1 Tax=Paenibacillus nasutitermitis TaxID=1652958 RepID=A0A917DQN2_9BACL|nr:GntR family transcriptional regulator [Paenibacillus nasutitermitis]GGD61606.1 UbiC transcription regulator-associated domain protein [Paenibacillus nasutitermitis]
MNRIILDHTLPIPLYHQLKEIFDFKIENGDWNQGQLIPTENELISYYEVSRTTVREAVNALVIEGKLEKKQGKGTLVCKPKMEEILGRLTGFAEEMAIKGLVPSAKVIEVMEVVPTALVREKLLNGQKNGKVLYIKRLRLANDEPIAIERSYWPADIGRLFGNLDLSTIAFYAVLEQNGVRLRYADENISARSADKGDAAILEVDEKSALMRMERVTYSIQGLPLEYTMTDYRSDRYMYKVRLER